MSVSSSQGFTSKRTEVLAITLGFLAFFSLYAFSLSSVILFFSSSSSSSSDPKRSTSSSSSSAGAGADFAGLDDGFPPSSVSTRAWRDRTRAFRSSVTVI